MTYTKFELLYKELFVNKWSVFKWIELIELLVIQMQYFEPFYWMQKYEVRLVYQKMCLQFIYSIYTQTGFGIK